MGTISHRLSQIIGGGIVAGAGYGLTFLKATAKAYFQFMESFPVNIPTLLDYSSWMLYGIGGLMAAWGVLGLLYAGIRHLLASGGDEQPPQQQGQKPQQPPQQGQAGRTQQQSTGQPRQRQQGGGRQQGQQRQPPRDQRDEPRR